MKTTEFSKPVEASGFFARLIGKKTSSYALAITIGADAVAKVDAEIAAAKAAIIEWVNRRDHKDFVMVTAYATQPVCDAIEQGIIRACRQDSDLAPLLKGLSIELNFNGKQKKTV